MTEVPNIDVQDDGHYVRLIIGDGNHKWQEINLRPAQVRLLAIRFTTIALGGSVAQKRAAA